MGLVKKMRADWQPSENPNLKVGEMIEITDYTALVRTGAAILVDEYGNEQPLPGQVFACPICYKGTGTLAEFVAHVDTHKKLTAEEKEEAPVSAPVAPAAVSAVETEPVAPVSETKPTVLVEAKPKK